MSEDNKPPEKFDGIYFLPGDSDDELVVSYWDFKEEMVGGKPIEATKIGDKFHVAFWKKDENDNPIFDDAFEAIFACPKTYVNNLAGAGVYGCLVRKTDKSEKWFQDYLFRTIGRDKVRQLIGTLKSIYENK